jgi:hypothetical protein
MAFRRLDAMGVRETRTQYRAVQCVLVAETPFFSSLRKQ